MSGKLHVALLDVDGTLLDTREYLMQAFEHTIATHGYEVPSREGIARFIGRSLRDCYEGLLPGVPFGPLKNTHAAFQETAMELVTSYDNARDSLELLRNNGWQLGVFSSRYGNLIPTLDQAGLAHMFDVIIDGKQVTRHKPDPEGIFLALGRLSATPEQTVMIGDAPVDIQAGKAAEVGMTIAITHGFGTREDLLAVGPDFLVDSLAEIPPILLGTSVK